MTFADLVALEPRLGSLEAEIKAIRRPDEGEVCANELWYRDGYKRRMSALVGWYRVGPRHDVLVTPEAYELAYSHLYNLLPDCRDCGCMAQLVTVDF